MRKAVVSILIDLALFIAVFTLGALHGRRTAALNTPKPQADTLILTDTIRVDYFTEVSRVVTDTIYLVRTDTIRRGDTTYIALPRETKTYSDSLFRAQVSGYQPTLDWVEVYPKTTTITNTIYKADTKRWGLGIQAGYGISQQGLSPYIGLGVSYNLWSW